MGSTLTKPETSKVVERQGAHHFSAAVASINGYRMSMEDAHCMYSAKNDIGNILDGNKSHATADSADADAAKSSPTASVLSLTAPAHTTFGVFDGHVNSTCAEFVATRLPKLIERLPRPLDRSSLQGTFIDLDEQYLDDDRDGGSTAAVAILEQVSAATFLCTICNVGDSRVLVIRKGELLFVTTDHKPSDAKEQARIERAGGRVELERVNGDLALSRAFGDGRFKDTDLPPPDRMVSCIPDIYQVELLPDDIIMICCDGVFEGSFSNTDVVQYVWKNFISGGGAGASGGSDPLTGQLTQDLAVVAASVCDEAVRRGSKDNITCMMIRLCPTGVDALQKFGQHSFVPSALPLVKSMYHERDAFESMCKLGGVGVPQAIKRRYEMLMNRHALVPPQFSELEARTAFSMSTNEEVQEEIKSFAGGPPLHVTLTEESKLDWFAKWWATSEPRPKLEDLFDDD